MKSCLAEHLKRAEVIKYISTWLRYMYALCTSSQYRVKSDLKAVAGTKSYSYTA